MRSASTGVRITVKTVTRLLNSGKCAFARDYRDGILRRRVLKASVSHHSSFNCPSNKGNDRADASFVSRHKPVKQRNRIYRVVLCKTWRADIVRGVPSMSRDSSEHRYSAIPPRFRSLRLFESPVRRIFPSRYLATKYNHRFSFRSLRVWDVRRQ